MAKNKSSQFGIVYSTDPAFKPLAEEEEEQASASPGDQKIKVRLETKHRAGKAVTLLEGFSGTDVEKQIVCKQLKAYCGTGGSVKTGDILIQGDNRDKILQWLLNKGYKQSKKI